MNARRHHATGALAAILIIGLCHVAHAHGIYLDAEPLDDGRLRVDAGFTDGSSGSPMRLVVRDKETGEVVVDQEINSSEPTTIAVPEKPLTVSVDGGAGHAVTRDVGAAPPPEIKESPAVPAGVYIVGMGPGDPKLLTLRAKEILDNANTIIAFERVVKRFPRLLGHRPVRRVPDGVWLPYGLDKENRNIGPEDLDRYRATRKTRALIVKDIKHALSHEEVVAVLTLGDPMSSAEWLWLPGILEDAHVEIVPGLPMANAAGPTADVER